MICHRRRDLSEPGPRELVGGECTHHCATGYDDTAAAAVRLDPTLPLL